MLQNFTLLDVEIILAGRICKSTILPKQIVKKVGEHYFPIILLILDAFWHFGTLISKSRHKFFMKIEIIW